MPVLVLLRAFFCRFSSMTTIHTINLPLADRVIALSPEIAKATDQPLDDLPLVSSVGDGLVLLGQANHGTVVCFRIPDDPSLIVAWHNFGSAAVVHTLRRRRLAHIDIILLGGADDAPVIEQVRSAVGLTEEEVAEIGEAARPLLVRMSHDGEKGIANLLGLILLVPMLCESNGV